MTDAPKDPDYKPVASGRSRIIEELITAADVRGMIAADADAIAREIWAGDLRDGARIEQRIRRLAELAKALGEL
jgi:hypothetical protein